MINKLSHEELAELLRAFKNTGGWESDMLAFGSQVQDAIERRETIIRRREACHMSGGHSFVLTGDSGFGEIQYGSGGETRIKWTGFGTCENCDARLGVTYREQS